MFPTVVTIVGKDLNAAVEAEVTRLLVSLGAGSYLRNTVLKPGYAMDIFLPKELSDVPDLAREKLQELGAFDIFVQANDTFRKKKLLVADMDSTIVQGETLDDLAGEFGLKDKISAITARAMNGDIGFEDAVRERVRLLKGMPEEALSKVAQGLQYSAGARQLIDGLKILGVRSVLVSGGFDVFTQKVAEDLGFDAHFGNTLGVEGGKLTGEVISTLLDKERKEVLLLEQASSLDIDPAYTMAVGDGANDMMMLKRSGTGVGYFAKPIVEEATPHHIRYSDLTALLYMQGYKEKEFLL